MTPEPAPDLSWLYPGPDDVPYATVKKTGRISWYILVHHGPTGWGPEGGGWFAIGSRAHAEAKARRCLAKYERHLARRRDTFEVTP